MCFAEASCSGCCEGVLVDGCDAVLWLCRKMLLKGGGRKNTPGLWLSSLSKYMEHFGWKLPKKVPVVYSINGFSLLF